MAASTTIFNGCDCVILLDNSSGTPVDISGSSNNVEYDFQNEVGEFKPFGTDWKSRITCGKDATIKLRIVASTAAAEAMRNVLDWFFNTDGQKTLTVDFPSSASGGVRLSGECVLESFNIPLAADDANPVMIDVNLLPSGAITPTYL